MSDPNPPDLEQQLRRLMRPVDPPGGFSAKVMAGLARGRQPQAPSPVAGARAPWMRRRRIWLPDAAVAAFAAVLIGAGLWSEERALEVRAREARIEVFQALRVSSQALNTALHVTVEPGGPG